MEKMPSILPSISLFLPSMDNWKLCCTQVNHVQLDNQLSSCLYPVIAAPVPPPRSVTAVSVPKPFLELSILEYTSPEHSMKQYKYIHALVQVRGTLHSALCTLHSALCTLHSAPCTLHQVCMDTIRLAPVPCCRNGHLVCNTCVQRTLFCPTCR